MLSYHYVKKMIIDAANKMRVSVNDVFIIACGWADEFFDHEKLISDWKRGRIHEWFYNFLIDLLADRIVEVEIA